MLHNNWIKCSNISPVMIKRRDIFPKPQTKMNPKDCKTQTYGHIAMWSNTMQRTSITSCSTKIRHVTSTCQTPYTACLTLNNSSYQHVRQCLLPWLTIVKIELVFSLASLLVCVIMGHGVAVILLVTGLFIHLRK